MLPLTRASLLLHGGRAPAETGEPVVSAIAQSVTFRMPAGEPADVRYTAYGNTFNVTLLERRLARLEGAEAAAVLSSGTAAMACTMLALLRPGDHLLASQWLYGGTQLFFEQELAAMGIEVSFIDPTETRAWRRHLRHNTRVLFVESPVNPTTRLVDVRIPAAIAHELGIALVVDSTLATPINFRPIEHGADVVIHSATKFLNGHHDVLAGVVCGTDAVVDEVRTKMQRWGQALDPFAVWLLERGLKTLDVRVQRQNANAMRLAQWAVAQTGIAVVHYPGLPSHPDHALARSVLDGYGGILSLILPGGAGSATRAMTRFQLFANAPSLGGVDSLVSEPRITSHRQLSATQRAAIGIPDGYLRLSIGIEDADDLIADLTQALE